MKIATSLRLTDAEITEAITAWLNDKHPEIVRGRKIRDVSTTFVEVYIEEGADATP